MYRTLREAAELLNISVSTIFNLKDRGLIAVSRHGVRKGFRIADEEIERFIQDRKETRQREVPEFSPKANPQGSFTHLKGERLLKAWASSSRKS